MSIADIIRSIEHQMLDDAMARAAQEAALTKPAPEPPDNEPDERRD